MVKDSVWAIAILTNCSSSAPVFDMMCSMLTTVLFTKWSPIAIYRFPAILVIMANLKPTSPDVIVSMVALARNPPALDTPS